MPVNRTLSFSVISVGWDITLLVARDQHRGSVPGDDRVRQQEVQELRHVADFLLEDGAVHYEHDGSEEDGRSVTLHHKDNTDEWDDGRTQVRGLDAYLLFHIRVHLCLF